MRKRRQGHRETGERREIESWAPWHGFSVVWGCRIEKAVAVPGAKQKLWGNQKKWERETKTKRGSLCGQWQEEVQWQWTAGLSQRLTQCSRKTVGEHTITWSRLKIFDNHSEEQLGSGTDVLGLERLWYPKEISMLVITVTSLFWREGEKIWIYWASECSQAGAWSNAWPRAEWEFQKSNSKQQKNRIHVLVRVDSRPASLRTSQTNWGSSEVRWPSHG